MRIFFTILLSIAVLWLCAFAVFLLQMQLPASEPQERADALIVLTGGKQRLERGFELLAKGDAPVLFISGVGEKVTLDEMLQAHATPAIRDAIAKSRAEIVLDHAASSTQTNAEQTAAFVRQRNYLTIRLITGHYHMPRSMVEFRAALPGVTIYREPVVPDSFAHHPWWSDADSRHLIWQEFHKYLAANGRLILRHL